MPCRFVAPVLLWPSLFEPLFGHAKLLRRDSIIIAGRLLFSGINRLDRPSSCFQAADVGNNRHVLQIRPIVGRYSLE